MNFCDRHGDWFHGGKCPKCFDADLKPLTKAELGALHTGLEFMVEYFIKVWPEETKLQSLKVLDRVKEHFVAAGGDSKELEV